MKRIGNLYENIYSLENLQLADTVARRRKGKQHGIKVHDRNREANIAQLQQLLKDKQFQTAAYLKKIIYEPKEREISILPYYPDRIVHHAVMNHLEGLFVSTFTADTYSCIKGRGIHKAKEAVEKALSNKTGTTYCLKLDIKKFYPSVDNEVLKAMLRRKLKDTDLLTLLDGIIDSQPGLPIGNYLSQYFANFYLTYFDHWLKEVKCVKHYFRYADDMVFLSDSKADLHQLRADISRYLAENLKLEVKGNYQVFPVASRGIDFVGYVIYHTHTLLRKSIKQSFARATRRINNRPSITSYLGWAKHCKSKNLIKKLLPNDDPKIQPVRCEIKEPHRRQNRDR